MKCQSCSAHATIHHTELIGGQKREVHLCRDCAIEQNLLQQSELTLPAILQTLLTQQIGPVPGELATLTCPACGIKYMEFRAQGRLGCPCDYEVFRAGLEPLLRKIHRSSTHRGKAPRRPGSSSAVSSELIELRRRLEQAIRKETYEEAARLRDLLRHKEAGHGPQ
jgi:protein arginine kinase activator